LFACSIERYSPLFEINSKYGRFGVNVDVLTRSPLNWMSVS
jgi:hypothetical protein